MTDNPSQLPVRSPATTSDMRYGVVHSRRLLIDTIRALNEFADAVTVIGAHAVHVWVQDAWGQLRCRLLVMPT